jgi:5'-deoxynucleotidase YfbR-like HD superfamily hydrolase
MGEIANIFNNPVVNLNRIKRFSNTTLVKEENVVEHIGQSIMIALVIYSKIDQSDINIKELIYKISIHDLDESVLADVPFDIKYSSDLIKSELERISLEKLSEYLYPELISDIFKSKCDEEHKKESLILKFIDPFQALIKLIREYKLQNTQELEFKVNQSRKNSINALYLILDSKLFNKKSTNYFKKLLKELKEFDPKNPI